MNRLLASPHRGAAELAASREYCRQLARSTGRNFYYSFLTLPRELRDDMCVLYAFMRRTDDLGDDESQPLERRARQLQEWRARLSSVLNASPTDAEFAADPILPGIADLVERRGIPAQYLFDVITGVESDLTPEVPRTYADLERYCYHVAGAVGLCCIHVWGFSGPGAEAAAVACGTAFQLTNILRDVAEDARHGRCYLPQDELAHFGVTPADFLLPTVSEPVRQLLGLQLTRAAGCYAAGASLFPHLTRPGRRILSAMFRIYGGLLGELDRRRFARLDCRIELSKARKVRAAVAGWLMPKAVLPGVGTK
ncbi:MAG: phytoene/squalene synthase family protein [Planctomycetaceae bacterium]